MENEGEVPNMEASDQVVKVEADTKAARIQELEEKLRQCQEELNENNEMTLLKDAKLIQLEKDIKTQANMIELEYQLKYDEEVSENKSLNKRLERLVKDNDELKTKLDSVSDNMEKLSSTAHTELPTSKEDIDQLIKSFKATQILLDQKSKEMKRYEEVNAELSIRFELEHERRVRAQAEIGDIEKERVILQNELEAKTQECIEKQQEMEEVKLGCDYKISKYASENQKMEAKLDKVVQEKDKRINYLQAKNSDINLKLESLEERYNNQVEVSNTLQKELQSSYVETQSLIKEMEMLNLMFAELENHIFSCETMKESDIPDHGSQNAKQIQVDEVLNIAKSTESYSSLLEKSCHNEVTTKNGTKMVLSVSKTFLKLKDLILEKNSLQEQMKKMKHMNNILCSQVNLHEEKLCDITDELNNTWFYVSKIKEQHKKLYSSEQILRAELAEKRKLLNNIRKELEESRVSMDLVKKMNAESEKQCVQLRADFAERKRMLTSSPESGISEMDSEEKMEDADCFELPRVENLDNVNVTHMLPGHVVDLFDDSDSEEIPDPFSDDENDEAIENIFCPMGTNGRVIVNENNFEVTDSENAEVEKEKDPGFTPIFVPSMSYLAQVPPSMQPNLFPSEKKESFADLPERERIDENALDEVDDNVRDLITRLSTSTSRGAFLANRLSDIHRRIAAGASLTDHNDWFDDNVEEVENQQREDDDEEDDLTVPSPELENTEELDTSETHNDLISPTSDDYDEQDEIRPASTDSLVLAIDEAINILDPMSMNRMPLSSPQPLTTLAQPLMGFQERRNENEESDNDYESEVNIDDEVEYEQVPQSSSDSSAEVTRFLIKHLPKQLTQLRNEKHELEDKIHDFEQVVSEQRMQMAEHERRVEVERSKTKRLEDRLSEVEQLLEKQTLQNAEIPIIFKVPVEIEQENVILNWTVESKSERACGYWTSFVTTGASDSDAVILPNLVQEVIPEDVGITTSLQVQCSFKGKYTLHIQGGETRMPQVSVNICPMKDLNSSEP